MSPKAVTVTYKSVDANKVLMGLSTRRALDFKHVPERIVFSVVRAKVCHSANINDGVFKIFV